MDWCGEWEDGERPAINADNPILETRVEAIEWPFERNGWKTNRRIINVLTRNHIRTLGDLMRSSEQELMRLPDMGRVSVENIKKALAGMGLKPLPRFDSSTREHYGV